MGARREFEIFDGEGDDEALGGIGSGRGAIGGAASGIGECFRGIRDVSKRG